MDSDIRWRPGRWTGESAVAGGGLWGVCNPSARTLPYNGIPNGRLCMGNLMVMIITSLQPMGRARAV